MAGACEPGGTDWPHSPAGKGAMAAEMGVWVLQSGRHAGISIKSFTSQ